MKKKEKNIELKLKRKLKILKIKKKVQNMAKNITRMNS